MTDSKRSYSATFRISTVPKRDISPASLCNRFLSGFTPHARCGQLTRTTLLKSEYDKGSITANIYLGLYYKYLCT